MRKLNAQINVSGGGGGGGGRGGGRGGGGGGGLSSATASVSAPAENFQAALKLAAEMLKEPAYPQDEFDRIKTQRLKALELTPTEPNQLAGDRMSRHLSPFAKSDPQYSPTREEQIPELQKATLDQARKFHEQFYGANYGVFAVVGPVNPVDIQKAAATLFGSWNTAKAYKPMVTPFKKVAPINEKIETPDKANARVPGRRALPDVAERSRLSGDRAGQLSVRRADHLAHLGSHPQPRGPELRRERAPDGAGGRGLGDAVGNRQPQSRRRTQGRGRASWTS